MYHGNGKALTIVLLVLCSYAVYSGKIKDEYISSTSYPVAAADYIMEEVRNGTIDLETMRLYNDYNYGSYLLFRGIPVFIDSRADLYSPEFNEGCNIFNDYMDISNIGSYYENKFNEYKFTHVITYTNSKLNLFLSMDENLNELYKDKYFVFYERINVDTSNAEE